VEEAAVDVHEREHGGRHGAHQRRGRVRRRRPLNRGPEAQPLPALPPSPGPTPAARARQLGEEGRGHYIASAYSEREAAVAGDDLSAVRDRSAPMQRSRLNHALITE
jgi:hypothetical protein